jgi:ATP-dependent DNA ligase
VAARIDHGRVQLLTDLDWTAKYPSAAAALANVNVKTAYIDGELCGVDEAGMDLAFGQLASVCRRSVSLAFPCFSISFSTLYRPRLPQGLQTTVSVGSRTSDRVNAPSRMAGR